MNKYLKVIKYIVILIVLIAQLGCRMPEYYDREQFYIEAGYVRSEAIMDGIYGSGTVSTTFEYEFKVGDVFIKQEKDLGISVNTDLVRIYEGARYEILYNPEDIENNIILLNKPVFDENINFGKTEGKIEVIRSSQGEFLWYGFLHILCRYWVNGREYMHRGGISKDLFFSDKDYNDITRKELRKLKRTYKGKTCTIEYDVNNPGISRLVESSVVENGEE